MLIRLTAEDRDRGHREIEGLESETWEQICFVFCRAEWVRLQIPYLAHRVKLSKLWREVLRISAWLLSSWTGLEELVDRISLQWRGTRWRIRNSPSVCNILILRRKKILERWKNIVLAFKSIDLTKCAFEVNNVQYNKVPLKRVQ